jgi:CRISPR-associated endonuclease/helicase Cas3
LWLASDRRRSLLADIGVGTVDQALLAALPVKFQSLRLTALSDRILVVDEAHSYDAYTTRLLRQLLTFQAALGGSAIVLSATLTTKTKNELLTAFASAAGWVKPHWCEKAESRTDVFPLASLLGAPETRGSYPPGETPPMPMRGTRRDLKVKRLDNAQAVVSSLIEHARAGRCAVWIRNTVQDAIDGADAFSGAAPELAPRLFHALSLQSEVRCSSLRQAPEREGLCRKGARLSPGPCSMMLARTVAEPSTLEVRWLGLPRGASASSQD